MCKRKDGKRLVHARAYLYLTSNRFHFFCADKKHDRQLTLELVNNKGTLDLTFVNRTTKEETSMSDLQTGVYTFKLNKGEKYLLKLRDHKSCGNRKIFIENL